MKRSETRTPSTLSLVSDIVSQAANLLQKEATLAKAQVGQNIARASTGIGLMLAAAILAMISLNLLAGAVVTWLVANGWSAAQATLMVAAGCGATALSILFLAVRSIKSAAQLPTQTFENFRRDADIIKEKLDA